MITPLDPPLGGSGCAPAPGRARALAEKRILELAHDQVSAAIAALDDLEKFRAGQVPFCSGCGCSSIVPCLRELDLTFCALRPSSSGHICSFCAEKTTTPNSTSH